MADALCIATARRLQPGKGVEEVATMMTAGEGAPAFKADIREENARNEESILPTFIPGAHVMGETSYGHCIYIKAGLVSDTELVQLVGKTAKQLNLKQFQVSPEWARPGEVAHLYAISLSGLPQHVSWRAMLWES